MAVLGAWPAFGQSLPAERRDLAGNTPSLNLVVQDVPAFLKWARLENLEVAGVYRPANIVVLPATQAGLAEKVVKNEQVLFVTYSSLSPREEVPVPGHNLYVNSVASSHAHFPGWNGVGSVISIREFPFFFSDVDLQNRLLPSPYAFGDTTGHAAVMATTAAGAGNSDPAGTGAAPGTQLLSSSFGALLPEETYQTQGITIQNHSYGIDIENEYGVNALAYDVSAAEAPKVLQVFSSGNKGLETAPAGQYAQTPGFANLTGNFKMAKNILTVGAVDSFGVVTPFSSRGPAYDGRIKPELVAFGQDGSSGAAALVSGAAAVVQQGLSEQIDSFPDAALVKTVLIHAADDRGRPGPDFEYGFGNLNLKKALELVQQQHFLTGRVGQGVTNTHSIIIPADAQNLKITLVWTDLPGIPGTDKALKNDLDLTVGSPDGLIHYPFVLHTVALADSLKMPAFRASDHLNNIEQIVIEQPAAGAYQVQVAGFFLNNSTQSYSLAYSWENAASFEWTFPGKQSTVAAGKDAVLAWNTNLPATTTQLSWKTVAASDWQLIGHDVNLAYSTLRWLAPDTFAALQLRMSVGNQVFLSDTFLVSRSLRTRVAFQCPDSVGLYWNAVAPTIRYRLYGLGNQYLEPLFDLQDTFVVLPTAVFLQKRFTVSALDPDSGLESLKSSAPDIRTQGLSCYITRLIAELTDTKTVNLQLEIGTRYGVTGIQLEKWRNGRFESLFSIDPVEELAYQRFDLQPSQGQNRYRAIILGQQGAVIQTDTVSVFYAGESNWVLFPNPVPPQEDVQLLYGGLEEFTVRIFDVWGRLVLDITPDDWLITLPVGHLPSGVYFLEARSTTGERLWSEQLLKSW